jgi:hypothetical protein
MYFLFVIPLSLQVSNSTELEHFERRAATSCVQMADVLDYIGGKIPNSSQAAAILSMKKNVHSEPCVLFDAGEAQPRHHVRELREDSVYYNEYTKENLKNIAYDTFHATALRLFSILLARSTIGILNTVPGDEITIEAYSSLLYDIGTAFGYAA